jgi:hypothetical protein
VSVEQFDVVDVVSIDKKTGHVILTISDHLDWSNSVEHQTILQAKLNKYLAFVESLEPREWGRALESLKQNEGLPNDFHGKILSNGNFANPDTGAIIGNIGDYLP